MCVRLTRRLRWTEVGCNLPVSELSDFACSRRFVGYFYRKGKGLTVPFENRILSLLQNSSLVNISVESWWHAIGKRRGLQRTPEEIVKACWKPNRIVASWLCLSRWRRLVLSIPFCKKVRCTVASRSFCLFLRHFLHDRIELVFRPNGHNSRSNFSLQKCTTIIRKIRFQFRD